MNGNPEQVNNCWFDLKLSNKNALREDWKLPNEPLIQGQWTLKAEQIFNPNWIQYCKDNGIHLLGDVMLFYKAPFLNSHRAHTDVTEHTHTTWALNWTIGNDTSYMMWFNKPADNIEKIYAKQGDEKYIEWDTRQLEMIDEKQIKNDIVLCRVDVPHSIKVGKQPRWCISARAWLGDGYEPMPEWNVVVDRLKELELI